MRLHLVHFLAFTLILHVVAAAGGVRFTDADKRALLAQGFDGVNVSARHHPQIVSMSLEAGKVTENVLGGPARLRAWITLRVEIRDPLEEDEIDALAWQIRKAAGKFDSVAVRFVLAGTPGADERDPEVGKPFYSWRLFHDDNLAVRSTVGLSARALAEQAAKLSLSKGEKLVGIWVDHSFGLGAVAIIAGKVPQAVLLADPATRYHLASRPRAGGNRVEATVEVGPLGTFRTDGIETDRFAVRLTAEDTLLVFTGRFELGDKPWLIARRWEPPTR